MAENELQTKVVLNSGTTIRLDIYVAQNLKLMRRSQLKHCNFSAKLNGKKVKISQLIKNGDNLELSWQEKSVLNLVAEDIPLDIIYEDDHVVVINKKQNMVVHPGAGNYSGTLVNALLMYLQKKNPCRSAALYFCSYGDLHYGLNTPCNAAEVRTRDVERAEGIEPYGSNKNNMAHNFSDKVRPFIVHRLDKDTSGVMIAALDMQSLSFLSDQFKDRKVKKTYIAIVNGVPKNSRGKITSNIVRDPKNRKCFTVSEDKGRTATTYYQVVSAFNGYALLKLRPKTGRTHQLRVHLRSIGTPILGDLIYNKRDKNFPDITLMLHAKNLLIKIPGENTRRFFTSKMPARFKELLHKLQRAPLNTSGTQDCV